MMAATTTTTTGMRVPADCGDDEEENDEEGVHPFDLQAIPAVRYQWKPKEFHQACNARHYGGDRTSQMLHFHTPSSSIGCSRASLIGGRCMSSSNGSIGPILRSIRRWHKWSRCSGSWDGEGLCVSSTTGM
jgi:hypothetical protein